MWLNDLHIEGTRTFCAKETRLKAGKEEEGKLEGQAEHSHLRARSESRLRHSEEEDRLHSKKISKEQGQKRETVQQFLYVELKSAHLQELKRPWETAETGLLSPGNELRKGGRDTC